MHSERLTLAGVVMLLSLLVTAGSVVAQDEIAVRISLDRDKIGLDEQAILEVSITGPSQNLPEPQLPTMPAFEIYSQGRSSNISIVNGQVESSVTYRYVLIPQKAGTFPLERIGFVYKNRRYNGNVVQLTVVDSGSSPGGASALQDKVADSNGDSRDYLLEAVVDNDSPFVGQQLTLTLRFMIAVRYYGSPELTEPSTTGFWTEVIGNPTPYSQTVSGRRYRVIERKYALFPTQTGELTIGRADITATIASRTKRRDPFSAFDDFFGRGRSVTVRSKPLKVTAKALPRDGRPADFNGSIGQYRMSVRADRTEVAVNDAVTVTIQITGTGNIKSVAEPAIPESDDFRVYRSSSNEKAVAQNDRLGGTKTFEEVFIPKRPGDLEIPPLTLTYFDPKAGTYRTHRSQPIKLKVTRPEGWVDAGEGSYQAPSMIIGSDARDIRHIKTELGRLQPVGQIPLMSSFYLIANGAPVLILGALIVWRRRQRRLADNVGLARSRLANKMARKRLARAQAMLEEGDSEQFFGEVYQALTSYLADKMNISPHGLTTDRVTELLAQHGAGEQLVDDTKGLIMACDMARYASSTLAGEDMTHTLAQAEEVMVKMEGVGFGK